MNFRKKMRRGKVGAARRCMHRRIASIPAALLAISLMALGAACSRQEPAFAEQISHSDSVSKRDAVQTDPAAVGQSPAMSPTEAQGATTQSASEEVQGSDIFAFVPEGAVIRIERRGDLDADGDIDVLLAVENKSADESAPRSLVLLRSAGSGTLEKAVDNPDAILCRSCGGTMGDPLADISVKAGEFSLRFEGGSRELWAREYRFVYTREVDDWLLEGVVNSTLDRINGEQQQSKATSSDIDPVSIKAFDAAITDADAEI
ncbi:hypothetical protein [Lysobacter sp. M15]|uniref:hypothetical protein n=1 Tax=Lysobacter sp. M15 TaxID=2916837 RepID=UPI001F57B100|nr:hypothetical protein [Lysobacter sp. M15]